jgi:hypothetical protein
MSKQSEENGNYDPMAAALQGEAKIRLAETMARIRAEEIRRKKFFADLEKRREAERAENREKLKERFLAEAKQRWTARGGDPAEFDARSEKVWRAHLEQSALEGESVQHELIAKKLSSGLYG